MKFHVHIPPHPLDPRGAEFDSLAAFEAAAPEIHQTDNNGMAYSEFFAQKHIRRQWRDALVMPVPVRVGSGTMIMLGVLPTVRGWVGEDAEIPFVAFVRGEAENERERKRMGIGMYDQELWRTPLDEPTSYRATQRIELRATDFPVPQFVEADIGRNAAGELVIVFDIGEGRVSLTLPDTETVVLDT